MSLPYFTSLVCVVFVLLSAWRMVVNKRVYLLHVSSMVIVATAGVMIPYVGRLEIGIPFPDYPEVLNRSSEAMLMFIMVVVLFQCLFGCYRKRRNDSDQAIITPRWNPTLYWSIFALAFFAGFRLLILNGGIAHVGAAFQNSSDVNSYYKIRTEVRSDLTESGGYGLATVALNYLLPIVIVMSAYAFKRTKVRSFKIVMWIAFIESFLLAMVFGQRNMVVFVLFYFLLTLAFMSVDQFERFAFSIKGFGYQIGLGLFFLAVGTAAFVFSNKESALMSAGISLWRVFVVPAGTAHYYFDLFPEVFPFRGWGGALNMAVGGTSTSDVTYFDVARASTGYTFGANANPLAIGYSGMGLAGVFLAAFIFCALCAIVDMKCSRLSSELRVVCLFPSIYGIVAIGNLPIVTGVVIYGFGLGSIVCFAIFGTLFRKATYAPRLQQSPVRRPAQRPARPQLGLPGPQT